VWGLSTLCLGEAVLDYVGDTARVLTSAMCVVLLAAVTLRDTDRRGRPNPGQTTLAAT